MAICCTIFQQENQSCRAQLLTAIANRHSGMRPTADHSQVYHPILKVHWAMPPVKGIKELLSPIERMTGSKAEWGGSWIQSNTDATWHQLKNIRRAATNRLFLSSSSNIRRGGGTSLDVPYWRNMVVSQWVVVSVVSMRRPLESPSASSWTACWISRRQVDRDSKPESDASCWMVTALRRKSTGRMACTMLLIVLGDCHVCVHCYSHPLVLPSLGRHGRLELLNHTL